MPRNNSVFVWGFKSKAEKIAVQLRVELGISPFKPLSASTLAKHLEIPIFTVEEAFCDDKNHPAYPVLSDTSKFNALWMPNEDGERIIIHNSNHSLYRQQSNLMHELAHIILDHSIPEEIGKVCMLYNLHYYNKQHEAEAKFLGACLQLTKPSILWVKKNNWSEEQISKYYTASNEMVRFRCNAIGNYRKT